MSIESIMFAALTQSGSLSALIGTRLYPDAVPQGASRPCVVYQRTGGLRVQVFGSTQAVAISAPVFLFSCWADTAAGALAVCAALRTALLSMSYPVTLLNEYTLRDPDVGYARRNLEVRVAHTGE